DAGDIACNPFDIKEAIATIEAAAQDLSAPGTRLVTIGGDHTIALPLLRVAHRLHGPVALLHFDAHLDTWDTYFGAEYTHGTPFRRAIEEGLLDTEAISHVGTRGPLYCKQDLDDDARMGFGIVTSADVMRRGPDEVAAMLRERIGDRPLYISIDIDVLDPAHAPGTGTRAPGGRRAHRQGAAGDPARAGRVQPGGRRRGRGRARLRPRGDHLDRGLARRLRPDQPARAEGEAIAERSRPARAGAAAV